MRPARTLSKLNQKEGFDCMSCAWPEPPRRKLAEPVHKPARDHCPPISWDGAFDVIAEELRVLPSPDGANFHTSGRTSNEAAFAHQLFVRAFGTNNMPDCPGTNHPRMLTALEQAKKKGAVIVAVNPLPEAGLMRCKNPQQVSGIAGRGTVLSDQFLRGPVPTSGGPRCVRLRRDRRPHL